ncbi:MAG: type II toxin-antitoxin system Phd/YefM family antitoxin [Deltaproteobacteria bacterium]|nr:type II toxin-antitoxin system Phd/YefM family antitoxin [Deltaproteobacteria bacterium]
MQKTNALKIRQNLGAMLKRLKKTGEPILLEKNREPAAVIISLEDYQKRFADYDADRKREAAVEKIKQANIKLPPGKTSLDLIREIRS